MHLYLPEEQKHTLRIEYIVRLSLVWLIGISIISISGIVFILPSYYMAYTQKNQLEKELETVISKGVATETKEIEDQVKAISNLTVKFNEGNATKSIVDILKLIDTARVVGIHISAFEFVNINKGSIDLKIAGIAETRDTLIMFKKNIEQTEGVQKVELPVSDLAKSKNIAFEMHVLSK